MTKSHFELVLGELKKWGVLLESDPNLPSVATLIAGEPMKGSWWSHSLAQTIFQVNELLDDHPDVLITKLLAGKVTFVHRKLWPALLTVATSEEPWQTRDLSAAASKVLTLVQTRGSIRSDDLTVGSVTRKEINEAVKVLERRLLIHSRQVHTESGAHAKVLEKWERWGKQQKLKAETSITKAKKKFEQTVEQLNQNFAANIKLPWQ